MSFKDALKKSFLESFAASDITTSRIIVVMGVTLLAALYIFFIYRILTRKSFYNKNFNISLTAMSLITAGIILSIQSNIVISLGMVGALSIVRFRTAIKDPLDLVFLFWSISVGIVCGAGLFELAILLSIVVTAAIFLLNLIPVAKAPVILVVNSGDTAGEAGIQAVVDKFARSSQIKSRSISAGQLNLVIELRCSQQAELTQALGSLEGVRNVSLLAHDGEVTF